jgi:hypothetical protein
MHFEAPPATRLPRETERVLDPRPRHAPAVRTPAPDACSQPGQSARSALLLLRPRAFRLARGSNSCTAHRQEERDRGAQDSYKKSHHH